ncbi:Nn.00g117390.m01.CDS01 [Neocucurbitaria sp. VM-36]
MSYRCVVCDQNFENEDTLQRHKKTSSAHTFDCATCNRHFDKSTALQQHLRDSPVHARSFRCDKCDRSFVSNQALQQHLQSSPAHAPAFDCATCSKNFSSKDALAQHLRDSPVHVPTFECGDCVRSFDSEQALEEHMREAPAHASSFDCELCDRSFGSEDALGQHRRDSPVHRQAPKTPLDMFFQSFRTFDYDPSLPPATSYSYLRDHERLRHDKSASDDAWSRYQDALQSELRMWYGAEDDLAAWHALCRAIGIDPLPQRCEQCEEVVRRTHVNIVDLIEWGRKRDQTEDQVQTFRNVTALRKYTKKTGKIFHNTLDQEDGNVVLRHLLRKMFFGNP